MSVSRGEATREKLELRDAVLARRRLAFVLVQIAFAMVVAPVQGQGSSANQAREQRSPRAQDLAPGSSPAAAKKKATLEGKLPSTDAAARPRIPAVEPSKVVEALEPPAFADKPAADKAGETSAAENGERASRGPEDEPPTVAARSPLPGVSERPAHISPRKRATATDEAVAEAVGEAVGEATVEVTATPPERAASTGSEPAPSDAAQSAPRTQVVDSQSTSTDPPSRPIDEQIADMDPLVLVRMEIKRRLPYFQGCAKAAQRRSGLEVRRLQATWTIAADGTIKDMKLDGIDDPKLIACILRAGARPFTVHPGLDLVVPTPIVFVRTPGR